MCKWLRSAKTFTKDEDGGVAIIFAMLAVVMVFVIGIAIDSARAYYATSKTLAALDAAALAAAKGMVEEGLSDAEIEDLAQKYFAANVSRGVDKGIRYGGLNVDADRDEAKVTVSVSGSLDTTFTAVMNVKQLDFDRSSTVVYDVKDIELGLMLDVTGSMCQPCTKIADLKEAAKMLVDTLIPEGGSERTRIALAPYSASVNAGSYANAVSNSESRDGCVVERTGRVSDDETAPYGANALLTIEAANRAIRHDNTVGRNERGYDYYACPNAEVTALTSDADDLRDAIDSYRTGGRTAGHLGVAWSWYMISPEWAGVFGGNSRPEPYGKKDLIKAVVLMTDGMFNAAYSGSDYHNEATDDSIDHAKALCDKMKDKNVVVYAVAFDAPSSAQRTLQACISHDGKFFNAKNGAELKQAFKEIGIRLSNLRIKS